MAEKQPARLQRKTAVGMDELVHMYIREMKLAAGLNTQRIFKAWDDASGAAAFTLRRFFRDGTLYITLGSSMVRSQLNFQLPQIQEKINAILADDPLFEKEDSRVGMVKKIVLK